VTRYLLDTNIISDVTKPIPSAALLAWMAEQADSDLFISALTVEKSGAGCWRSRKEKNALFWKPGSPVRMDHKHFSRAACSRSTKRRASSVTDNEKDFTGLKFVNPLRGRRVE